MFPKRVPFPEGCLCPLTLRLDRRCPPNDGPQKPPQVLSLVHAASLSSAVWSLGVSPSLRRPINRLAPHGQGQGHSESLPQVCGAARALRLTLSPSLVPRDHSVRWSPGSRISILRMAHIPPPPCLCPPPGHGRPAGFPPVLTPVLARPGGRGPLPRQTRSKVLGPRTLWLNPRLPDRRPGRAACLEDGSAVQALRNTACPSPRWPASMICFPADQWWGGGARPAWTPVRCLPI